MGLLEIRDRMCVRVPVVPVVREVLGENAENKGVINHLRGFYCVRKLHKAGRICTRRVANFEWSDYRIWS